jgi:hypothetical protein
VGDLVLDRDLQGDPEALLDAPQGADVALAEPAFPAGQPAEGDMCAHERDAGGVQAQEAAFGDLLDRALDQRPLHQPVRHLVDQGGIGQGGIGRWRIGARHRATPRRWPRSR